MEELTVVINLQCTSCNRSDKLSLLSCVAEGSDGPTLIGHCTRCNVNIGWDMHDIQMEYWREVGQPPNNPATN